MCEYSSVNIMLHKLTKSNLKTQIFLPSVMRSDFTQLKNTISESRDTEEFIHHLDRTIVFTRKFRESDGKKTYHFCTMKDGFSPSFYL